MKFVFTGRIRQKLKEKHGVIPEEVKQCFCNRAGRFLEDTREEHRTAPPTQWFISETETGRRLKVVFVEDVDEGVVYIKTTYEPNATEEKIYGKYS
ncbi:MAG: ADP-ribosyl-(dinitrogen reductase) hydrolase [Deltaproteobacteria bacterium]|nr:ADP-ribosyl-(dinitrogen reductase) hydrolase [Deltaproteobacteria bacterium]